jgi:hypothetical protein
MAILCNGGQTETWLTMTRWLVKSWRPESEGYPLIKHYKHDCKLCVLNDAWRQVTEHAKPWDINPKVMGWTVEKLTGAPGQWKIVFHDRQELGELPVRHGH